MNSYLENAPLKTRRTIKSYVRREGRITLRQKLAIDRLWEKYGLPHEGDLLNLDDLFGESSQKIFDIGFGAGESLLAWAGSDNKLGIMGCDVHRPGIGKVLVMLDKNDHNNVRLFCADAVDVLRAKIHDQSLDRVQLFFPDPWPKKRHHKRRLLQADFIKLVFKKLKKGGIFHFATDWEDYAAQSLEVFAGLIKQGYSIQGGIVDRPPTRPLTKFEKRGKALGHSIWDMVYIKED